MAISFILIVYNNLIFYSVLDLQKKMLDFTLGLNLISSYMIKDLQNCTRWQNNYKVH